MFKSYFLTNLLIGFLPNAIERNFMVIRSIMSKCTNYMLCLEDIIETSTHKKLQV